MAGLCRVVRGKSRAAAGDALALLAPVLAGDLAEIPPDSLTAVYALFVLIWNDELDMARSICDAVWPEPAARDR